jgi:hypothetical protein
MTITLELIDDSTKLTQWVYVGLCKGNGGFLVDDGAVLSYLEWLVIPFVIHLHAI